MTRTAIIGYFNHKWSVVFKEKGTIIDTSTYVEWTEAANAIRLWLERGE